MKETEDSEMECTVVCRCMEEDGSELGMSGEQRRDTVCEFTMREVL